MSIASRRLQRSQITNATNYPTITVGADPVGAASYAIPVEKVLYVSPTGSNANSGLTVTMPLQTVTAAIAKITDSGWTIVMREGVYHEQVTIANSVPPLSIQNYPGEAVWFDGSEAYNPVWTDNGDGTWTAPYAISFDRALSKGTLPTVYDGDAARVVIDQVWFNDVALQPVADATIPLAGQFSVDQVAHTLTVGTSPVSKTIRIATLNYAVSRYNAATASLSIKGVGIRRYSPVFLEWLWAALRVGPASEIEQVTIRESGLVGLNLYGSGSTVRRCTIEDIYYAGVESSAEIIFESNIIRRINRWGYWNPEPGAAAIKLFAHSDGGVVRNNYIEDTPNCTGVWFDTSCTRLQIINNTIIGTSHLGDSYRGKTGLALESSDGGYYNGTQYYSYVIGNRITDFRFAGMNLLNSGYIKIWNNKIYTGNALYLWQDNRENTGSDSASGDPIISPWHTTGNEICNNDLQSPTAYGQHQIIAYPKTDAAVAYRGGDMFTIIKGNWFKPWPSIGSVISLGNASGSNLFGYNTLSALASAGADVGGPFGTSRLDSNAQQTTAPDSSIAQALPVDVAAAYGVPVGVQAIGPVLPSLVCAT